MDFQDVTANLVLQGTMPKKRAENASLIRREAFESILANIRPQSRKQAPTRNAKGLNM